jgi:hypothetical protein
MTMSKHHRPRKPRGDCEHDWVYEMTNDKGDYYRCTICDRRAHEYEAMGTNKPFGYKHKNGDQDEDC